MVVKESIKKEESVFQKVRRLRKEKEDKEAADAKQKIIDDELEKKRMESIIEPYLENLKENLYKKESQSFWVFPDRTGFKKIKNESDKSIEQIFQKDTKKYAGRNVVKFVISIQKDPKKGAIISFKRDHGIHILVDMIVMPIDKNGEFTAKQWGTRFTWRNKDFKTTKLTFKLLETLMNPLVKLDYYSRTIMGESITSYIEDLQKLGYKFDDALSPLAGV
jgi:hypothetical protein